MIARSSFTIDARARSSPYTISALLNSSPSGELTYFALIEYSTHGSSRAPEAADATARVCEWEHQSLTEVVVAPAVDEAGGAQLIRFVAALAGFAGDEVPAGRESQPERLARLDAQIALLEVGTDTLRRRRFPQLALEEPSGRVEQIEEAIAAIAALLGLWRVLLVLEGNAASFGQPLDRLHEVEALDLADEADQIAAYTTAEAVIETAISVHREAGCTLLVERTPSDPAGANPAERGVGVHDLDDVGRVADLLDGCLLDHCHG